MLTDLNLTIGDFDVKSSTNDDNLLSCPGPGVGVFLNDLTELTVSDHAVDFSTLMSAMLANIVLEKNRNRV